MIVMVTIPSLQVKEILQEEEDLSEIVQLVGKVGHLPLTNQLIACKHPRTFSMIPWCTWLDSLYMHVCKYTYVYMYMYVLCVSAHL